MKRICIILVLSTILLFSGCGSQNSTATEEAYRRGYKDGLVDATDLVEENDSSPSSLSFSPSSYKEAYWNGFDVGFTQSYSEFYGNYNDDEYMGIPDNLEDWLDEGIGSHLAYITDDSTPDYIVQGAKDGFMDGFELGWETWSEGKITRSWGKGSRFQDN